MTSVSGQRDELKQESREAQCQDIEGQEPQPLFSHLCYLDPSGVALATSAVSEAGRSMQEPGGRRSDTSPVLVPVLDARRRPPRVGGARLGRQGFELARLTAEEYAAASAVDPFSMEGDGDATARYYRAMESAVQRATGAVYVRCYNFVLRRSSIAGVHTRAFDDNAARGPVNGVHCDFTPDAPGIGQLRDLARRLGLDGLRFAVVNCWRSTSAVPVAQWPMAVCDASTVNEARDLVPQRSPENGNMIYSVLPSSAHRWYTYPGMTSHEVLLFKQFDTDPAVPRFTPHTAFDHPETPRDAPPRTSCEVRAVCFFSGDGGVGAGHREALGKLATKGVGMVSSDLAGVSKL